MIAVPHAFAERYAHARVNFLEAAAAAGLQVELHPHPLPGRDGEVMAMDVARSGPMDAENVLIVTSGTHGVEGYCGSGVQVFALQDAEWLAHAADQGVAVLYVHGVNPYGFSHLRRVTQENVDMNRNFADFSQPLPVNAAYAELHSTLLPTEWPPTDANRQAIETFIAQRGFPLYQEAVSRGQYEFPQGLFFGGSGPTWSRQTLTQVLKKHLAQAQKVAWVDIHTGLGPSGIGERIFADQDKPASLARARAWWGGNGATPVTSIYDGTSVSAKLTGMMCFVMPQEFPGVEYTGIAIEYGTLPMPEVLQALRGEAWLQMHPETPPDQAQQLKQALLDAFYVQTDAWKGQVISQARQALFQAVAGLSAPGA